MVLKYSSRQVEINVAAEAATCFCLLFANQEYLFKRDGKWYGEVSNGLKRFQIISSNNSVQQYISSNDVEIGSGVCVGVPPTVCVGAAK